MSTSLLYHAFGAVIVFAKAIVIKIMIGVRTLHSEQRQYKVLSQLGKSHAGRLRTTGNLFIDFVY